jgi:hypothetical protein
MNNVHEDAPVVFESKWTLSYLRGPRKANITIRLVALVWGAAQLIWYRHDRTTDPPGQRIKEQCLQECRIRRNSERPEQACLATG